MYGTLHILENMDKWKGHIYTDIPLKKRDGD